jgi:hypothetical protein
MQCPLCGGPLRLEGLQTFVCEREHEMNADQMRAAASTRVATALWMAIEALETEAEALRVMTAHGLDRGDGDQDLADRAAADARMLRELASEHVPTDGARGAPNGV